MATSTKATHLVDPDKEPTETYPKEIASNLKAFTKSLEDVDDIIEPLVNSSLPAIHSQLSTLDRAKLDLVSAYAINALFWVYLGTQGINPREHAVKHELSRIQKYMKRAQEIEDKEKAVRLNKGAAKRFIKNALFEPGNKGPSNPKKRRQDTQHNRGPRK